MRKVDHLIEQTAVSPDIRSCGVSFFLPDLWTGVVRGANFCVSHAVPTDVADIHIPQFDSQSLRQVEVGCLDVPVDDLGAMQSSQTVCHLPRVHAYLFLTKRPSFLASSRHELQ